MIRESNGSATFAVRVVPRASKNQIVGMQGDEFRIRLKAPPVEGKANDALVRFLADILKIGRGQIELVSGYTARRKIIRVRGLTPETIKERMK